MLGFFCFVFLREGGVYCLLFIVFSRLGCTGYIFVCVFSLLCRCSRTKENPSIHPSLSFLVFSSCREPFTSDKAPALIPACLFMECHSRGPSLLLLLLLYVLLEVGSEIEVSNCSFSLLRPLSIYRSRSLARSLHWKRVLLRLLAFVQIHTYVRILVVQARYTVG